MLPRPHQVLLVHPPNRGPPFAIARWRDLRCHLDPAGGRKRADRRSAATGCQI